MGKIIVYMIDKPGAVCYNGVTNIFRRCLMDNKITFGIMCIIFNSIGVPCFMQGQTKAGILRIVLNFVTCGVIGVINTVMGIILGIQVLNMTDEEYEAQKGNIAKGIPAK